DAVVGGYSSNVELSSLFSIEESAPDSLITKGLGFLGQELLHIKKDPIIRILRYTLYHYE
ncbi:hypothetical protein KBC86_04380, partial [Candidatus Gracilibacteria bacterium]|nr:hypothetical protein [Candidatus Gracilibacteria bacterium]